MISFLYKGSSGARTFSVKYPSVQKINTVDKTELTIDGDQTNELCRDPVSRPTGEEYKPHKEPPNLTFFVRLGSISRVFELARNYFLLDPVQPNTLSET